MHFNKFFVGSETVSVEAETETETVSSETENKTETLASETETRHETHKHCLETCLETETRLETLYTGAYKLQEIASRSGFT